VPFTFSTCGSTGGSEGVRWTVLEDPVQVSQAAVDRFRDLIKRLPGSDGHDASNRPVRPLTTRAILSA